MRLDIYNNKDVSDIPLTGNPQITYFKSVYRKHTHFSIESSREEINNSNLKTNIDLSGDLLKSIELEIKITGNTGPIPDNLGTALINNIKLFVGDTKIEELSGPYMEMYMKLKNPRALHTFYNDNDTTLNCQQGTMEQILSLSGGVFNTAPKITTRKIDLVLPIPFSFCRDTGHALPIFLFRSNRSLYISLNTNDNILTTTNIDYYYIKHFIFLTETERARFKASNNEYLHEHITEQDIDLNNHIIRIDQIGNIKSLMWVNDINNDCKYNIKINTANLFIQDKSYHYFTRKTISDAGYPGGGCSVSEGKIVHDDSIAYYSFALKDFDKIDPLAPSGSISSSANRIYLINNKTGDSEVIKLYIKSYNIINISEDFITLQYVY